MNSKIYLGFVEHERMAPANHRFRYPLYFYGLDLDELSGLDRKLLLFGYNRRRPAAIHDADYLDERPGTIKEKAIRILKEKLPAVTVSRILLITSARYLNYIFNPVSFYYCFDDRNRVSAMVAEVNNTFGERHVYIPDKQDRAEEAGNIGVYGIPKAFHVSPFNNMDGDYEFFFSRPDADIEVRINLIREGAPVFSARLWGTAHPLTSGNLLKMIIRHPLVPHLTKPRIFLEAARLYFAKHLTYHDKPDPISPMTIKRSS